MVTSTGEFVNAVVAVGQRVGDLPVCSIYAGHVFDLERGVLVMVDVHVRGEDGAGEAAALILAGRFGLAGPDYDRGLVSYQGFVPALGFVVSTFTAATAEPANHTGPADHTGHGSGRGVG